MKQLSLVLLLLGSAVSAQPANKAELRKDQALFQVKCASCHSVACNRLGPKLENVFGRKAGAVPDFKGYTASLRDSGVVWDEKTLDAFLLDGSKMIPGNSMSAVERVTDARDRRALIAHMRRQDRSADLC